MVIAVRFDTRDFKEGYRLELLYGAQYTDSRECRCEYRPDNRRRREPFSCCLTFISPGSTAELDPSMPVPPRTRTPLKCPFFARRRVPSVIT
jgi:hypothetical protein